MLSETHIVTSRNAAAACRSSCPRDYPSLFSSFFCPDLPAQADLPHPVQKTRPQAPRMQLGSPAQPGTRTSPPWAGLTSTWLPREGSGGGGSGLWVLRGCGGSSFYTWVASQAHPSMHPASPLPPGGLLHLARPHWAGQTDHQRLTISSVVSQSPAEQVDLSSCPKSKFHPAAGPRGGGRGSGPGDDPGWPPCPRRQQKADH